MKKVWASLGFVGLVVACGRPVEVECRQDGECGDRAVCREGGCQKNILDELAASGHRDFVQFTRDAALYDELVDRSDLTLFVPRDGNFDGSTFDCIEALKLDPMNFRLFVRKHVGMGLMDMTGDVLDARASRGEPVDTEAFEVLETGIEAGETRLDGLSVDGEVEGHNGRAFSLSGGILLPDGELPPACDGLR